MWNLAFHITAPKQLCGGEFFDILDSSNVELARHPHAGSLYSNRLDSSTGSEFFNDPASCKLTPDV